MLTKDHWALQINGYHTPLLSAPKQDANPHLSSENQTLLQEEIHTLLEKHAIQKVLADTEYFYSSMLWYPRKMVARDQLSTLKKALQDGEPSHRVRLDDKDRLEGCLFMVPISPSPLL